MRNHFTSEDRKKIKEGIRGKYAKASVSPEGLFRYPTGRPGLEALGYGTETIQALPAAAVDSYCGVGNPFTPGLIGGGEYVLDIGCGGGVDTLVAAMMVGPRGKAIGIDMTLEMLRRARGNLQKASLPNVFFQEASAEDLPYRDRGFDVVISNGVFNLIPDKARALAEVFRVLKPCGRLMLADQVLVGALPGDEKARIDSWFR